MNMISTRTHGVLDYATGALLLAAPYLFGFAGTGVAQWVPTVLGAGLIVYSLLTRYELGAVKLIPMPAHLGLDVASGLLLAVSPFLFGFSGLVWVPHVLVGLLEIGSGVITSRVPGTDAAALG